MMADEPNWREMAFSLLNGGQSDKEVAAALAVPIGTYRSWRYGDAKPNYMNGRRFVEYYERCKHLKIQAQKAV